jgi:hypothetical protein
MLLEHLCISPRALPVQYWLDPISYDPIGRELGHGGEAYILLGTDEDVVIREMYSRGSIESSFERQCLQTVCTHSSPGLITSLTNPQQRICKEVMIHWQLRDKNILPLLGVFSREDGLLLPVLPYIHEGAALSWLKKNGTPDALGRIVSTVSASSVAQLITYHSFEEQSVALHIFTIINLR